MRQKIAVIGGVASGPAAAAQAQRTNPDADVVLFEKGPDISYGACELPYFLSGQIPCADTLVVLTPQAFEHTRGARVRTEHEVLGIHPKRCRLDVKERRTGRITEERFDKFILAIGARARLPDIQGCEAPNVFAVRQLDEARRLKRALDDVRHAVILGGGYVGIEVAESLRTLGKRVTLLEPHGLPLHSYLDTQHQRIVADELKKHGVTVRRERAVAVETDASGTARAVRTDHGELVGCQTVIAAIGTVPETTLATRAHISIGTTGAVAVDAHMRTNLPNVWACGDCIEVHRVIDGKAVYRPLSPAAFRTARVAGTNAARRGRGPRARFPGVVGASAVKVFDLEAASVGLQCNEALASNFDAFTVRLSGTSRVSFYPGAQPLHVALTVERTTGRLLGASLVGQEGAVWRANVLVACIYDHKSVADIKDLDLIYAPPFGPSIDPVIAAARAATKQLGRPTP